MFLNIYTEILLHSVIFVYNVLYENGVDNMMIMLLPVEFIIIIMIMMITMTFSMRQSEQCLSSGISQAFLVTFQSDHSQLPTRFYFISFFLFSSSYFCCIEPKNSLRFHLAVGHTLIVCVSECVGV